MTGPEWLSAGLAQQRAGRFAEAERIYKEILKANPDEADALHLTGLIAATHGQIQTAEQNIARAIQCRPDRADFHASMGNLFFARQMIEQMADCYRCALLLSYFSAIPAPFAEIIGHAGRNPSDHYFPADPAQYRSQYLQDVFLDRWVFNGLINGVFVDIGAHDGVSYSNSYFFETTRGWHGIAIEPNPDVYAQLRGNRGCLCLNCGVSNAPGSVPFLKISGRSEMFSGIVTHYPPEHRARIEEEIRQSGGSSEIIAVETRTLNDIAAQAVLEEITYLSIDTEGSELPILASIDFDRIFVHALTVEFNFEPIKDQMISLMRTRGFDPIQTLGHDLVFLNRASPYHAQFHRLRAG
jgi:FkbM family methyltransferase